MTADPILLPTAEAGRAPVTASRWAQLRAVMSVAVRSPSFVIGIVVVAFWVFDSIGWRLISPYDPQSQDLLATLKGPSGSHLLGTDSLGRDVLSRVLAGAASVLSIAPLGTLLGVTGGVVIGLVTGFYRGSLDVVLGRVIDAVLSLPSVIVAALVLALLGTSKPGLIIVTGVLFAPIVARTVRAAVLTEREKEYVAAARLRGESGLYIMGAEILPNITAPIIVEATVRLGYAIFLVATLSYLSLGVQPPSPDWGLTVSLERAYVAVQSWTVLAPAIALGSLVVGVVLVADGLSKAIDA